MSAYVVSPEVITAIIAAGLKLHDPGYDLSWLAPVADTPETLLATETHERGCWAGPDAAAVYRARVRKLTYETASAVGQMLTDANYESVNWRYDEHDTPDMYEYHTDGAPMLTVPQALSTLAHYEYQACEPPTWDLCEARAFCDALRNMLCDSLAEMGPWDFCDEWSGPRYHIFTRQAAS